MENSSSCFISLKLGHRSLGIKKDKRGQICIFRSWCIDPNNSNGSDILHSIYNMLQLRNPQHIFSDRKEKRKITDRRGAKNQTRVELLRPGTVTWTAQSVSKHIKRKSGCRIAWKNHIVTSSPHHHRQHPAPQPRTSLEAKKMWILRSIIPKNIHTMNKSDKYIFQIQQ